MNLSSPISKSKRIVSENIYLNHSEYITVIVLYNERVYPTLYKGAFAHEITYKIKGNKYVQGRGWIVNNSCDSVIYGESLIGNIINYKVTTSLKNALQYYCEDNNIYYNNRKQK